ncbi:hypothetical protein [Filimonas lacunae]|uniref:hypothetical protein n=1 Tax=Filimonas lacunae TaxID=477680 RepID=UPI000970982C|nr:hypothetical protein [Filimonas lacunae]
MVINRRFCTFVLRMHKYWYILLLAISGLLILPVVSSYACQPQHACCKKKKSTHTKVVAKQSNSQHHCKGCGNCKHSGCQCTPPFNSLVSVLPPAPLSYPAPNHSQVLLWFYTENLPPSVYLSSKQPPKLA